MTLEQGSLDNISKNSTIQNRWFYPIDLEDDLKGIIGLSDKFVDEVLNSAWEYTRCVIPHFTNWSRYIAFTRTIVIAVVVEFRGNLVDIAASDTGEILGYNLHDLLDTVFGGTPYRKEMECEFQAFLLFTGEKTSNRCNSDLFRRYVNALAESPKNWFRLRDCDALARFTLAGALACNDINNVLFSEDQFQVLTEIADTLYDAVAFYKHRAEGETHNTFAYAGNEVRGECYHRCREILWRLDVAWAGTPKQCVVNFIRIFGGPIHMTTRRYRFVEDSLTIGNPETDDVVTQTLQNFKLWNRVMTERECNTQQSTRYSTVVAQSSKLMFSGLAEMLESGDNRYCDGCLYLNGAEVSRRFSGVELCGSCRKQWQTYLGGLPARTEQVFPELSYITPAAK